MVWRAVPMFVVAAAAAGARVAKPEVCSKPSPSKHLVVFSASSLVTHASQSYTARLQSERRATTKRSIAHHEKRKTMLQARQTCVAGRVRASSSRSCAVIRAQAGGSTQCAGVQSTIASLTKRAASIALSTTLSLSILATGEFGVF